MRYLLNASTTILLLQQPVDPMPEETPKMTPTTKDILLKVRKMVPPMLEKFHKGKSYSASLTSTESDSIKGRWGEWQ